MVQCRWRDRGSHKRGEVPLDVATLIWIWVVVIVDNIGERQSQVDDLGSSSIVRMRLIDEGGSILTKSFSLDFD